VTKGKKASVNFMAGLRTIEDRDAVRRHSPVQPASPPPAPTKELPASLRIQQQLSRVGKVAVTQWVDPAVRKQLARLALDQDRTQAELLAEGLNLVFEKYGQPPIASHIQDESSLLQPTA
jgi:hypothetical protein